MKLVFILLISFFLVSCATLCPQQKQAVLLDQQSFIQAFEDFQMTNRIDKLQEFRADFPNSAWADRAETIILYSLELDQRKAQNEKLMASEQQNILELEQLEKINKKLSKNLEQLKTLNRELTKTIEQLKSSLIQSEKHPK